MKVHPYAEALPMMSDDELDALADDIKANGLRHPIVLDADGVLIDGRNRLAACDLAGVEPAFTTLPDGTDAVDLIVGANLQRRHLSVGQRAVAHALALEQQGKRRGDRWAKNAIPDNLSDTSKSSWFQRMYQAGLLLDGARRWPDDAGDLPRRVMQGEVPFAAAVETVKNLEAAGALVEARKQQPAREWLFEIAAIETALESLAEKPPELSHPITGQDARAHEATAKKIRSHLRRIAAFIEEHT